MYGIVIFYETNQEAKTITEIGRTKTLPYFDALTVYSETHNPASQLIKFETDKERRVESHNLSLRVKDKKWLESLFESI